MQASISVGHGLSDCPLIENLYRPQHSQHVFYPCHPLHHHPNPSQLHLSISHLQCHHGVYVRFHSRINENHPRIIDTSQFFSNRRACVNRKQMNSQKHASPRGVPGRSGRRDQNGDSRNRLTYAFPSLRKGFKPHILHQCDSGGHPYLFWTFQNYGQEYGRVVEGCNKLSSSEREERYQR